MTATQSQIRDALKWFNYDAFPGVGSFKECEEMKTIRTILQSALDTQKPAGDAAYDFSASKAYVKKNHSLLSDAALIIKAEKSAAITRDSAEALAALDGCWEICDESNLPYVNPDNATEFVNRYSSVIRAALTGDCGGGDLPVAYWARYPDGSGTIHEDKDMAEIYAERAFTKCTVIPVYTKALTADNAKRGGSE